MARSDQLHGWMLPHSTPDLLWPLGHVMISSPPNTPPTHPPTLVHKILLMMIISQNVRLHPFYVHVCVCVCFGYSHHLK